MKKPFLVGVTGGIGSGKSLVCKIFEVLGIQVYYADDKAKWLMSNEPELIRDIKITFGEKSFQNETLNRQYLAEKVFNNEQELKKLNQMVHPAVGKDFKKWVDENQQDVYLLKEAALIYESGSYKSLDLIINVHAPAEIRMERVLKRDPYRDRKQVEEIIKKQLSDEERIRKADFTIKNDGQHLVIPQVLTIHKEIIKSKLKLLRYN